MMHLPMSARPGIHLTPPHLAASIRRAALITAAIATTACSSTTPPPNLTPLLWVIIPAIFIALAIYEAVLKRQRTRALEMGQDVIASWTCPDEVWIAHTRNKLRSTLRFAGIFALLIFGLAAILHVTGRIVFGALGALAVAAFVALCVAPFLLIRWWPTRLRDVRVVIGRNGAIAAGRNHTWRRTNQRFAGARIQADSPRLLVIEWIENPGMSQQTHGSLEIPLGPADEAAAQRVVRSLGELRGDGLIHDEVDDYINSQ